MSITKPWTPSKSTKLCSCHFENVPNPRSRDPKIPTVFSHRPAKKTVNRPPRTYRKRISETTSQREKAEGSLTKKQDTAVTASLEMVEGGPAMCLDPITDIHQPSRDDQSPNNSEDESTDQYGDESDEEPDEPEFRNPDHDYIQMNDDISSSRLLQNYPDLQEILKQGETDKSKAKELDQLKQSGAILRLDNIKDNPKLFQYYTGLKYDVFQALYCYLEPKAKDMKYPYGSRTELFTHHASANRKKPGKVRSTRLDEEMFYTLVKLRLGLQSNDCAVRFGLSPSRFSSISTAWITLLSTELEKICKMPPTTEIQDSEKAECFDEFSNVRIIIDCTELFAETPSSIGVHKQFHSNYKHHSTVKFMVGMNTGGAITYISEMFGGRASDKFITNESGDMLSSLNPGEKVMADRGFTIENDLPLGVQLVMPSFKHKDKSQFSKEELHKNKKISEARVHIERAIRRIKQFLILANEMKLSQVDIYESIFKACGYLVNFQDPFLKV